MKYFKDSDPLVECVPNFSEGRNPEVIEAIAAAISGVRDVRLLHTDMGRDAHRTVITFAGRPEAVAEAAFRAIATAAELIDMSVHQGAHPRMGATDVCPLIPLRNISMEEVVALSRQLGARVGAELQLPVYLYERSALKPERSNLAYLRKGEYESIAAKLRDEAWTPDFGPREFHRTAGMTAIGARPILIAYNINLTTDDASIARRIAAALRESGSLYNGIRRPGKMKGVKAIGWHMPTYGCAQVSTNITDIHQAPIHLVYETVRQLAIAEGSSVQGSELIGLIPEEILLNAGRFYSSTTFHETDKNKLISLSINSLGLNTLSDFKAEEQILERRL